MAELTVYYCECAVGFSDEIGLDDGGYFAALVRMFEQALTLIGSLPPEDGKPLFTRLNRSRKFTDEFGYGVGSELDFLFDQYARSRPKPSRAPAVSSD